MDMAEKQILDVTRRRKTTDFKSSNEVVNEVIENIHKMSAQKSGVTGVATGYRDLDNTTNGFQRDVYKRQNFIVNGLNRMGLQCPMPQGAFYVFPSIKHTGMSSEEFCEKLLEKEKVAVVPGNAFGASGEGFVRISYAYSIEEIKGALERISRFLGTC